MPGAIAPSLRRLRSRRVGVAGLAVLAVAAAGCGSSHHATSATTDRTAATSAPSTTANGPGPTASSPTTTAPPATTTTSTTVPKPVASPIGALPTYLVGRQGRITVAVYDRLTGQTWTMDPGRHEDAGPLAAIEIAATRLSFLRPKGSVDRAEGTVLTSLLTDNDLAAGARTWYLAGSAPGITAFGNKLGLTGTILPDESPVGATWPTWDVTSTTASDQVRLFKAVAYPGPLLDGPARSFLRSVLTPSPTATRWGVDSGVPAKGMSVELDNGTLALASNDWQVNSEGAIRGDGRDYVVAVLTSGNPNAAYGEQTIEAISTIVWGDLAPSS